MILGVRVKHLIKVSLYLKAIAFNRVQSNDIVVVLSYEDYTKKETKELENLQDIVK